MEQETFALCQLVLFLLLLEASLFVQNNRTHPEISGVLREHERREDDQSIEVCSERRKIKVLRFYYPVLVHSNAFQQ